MRHPLRFALSGFVLALAAVSFAQAAPVVRNILPVNRIKIGQIATAKSVFQGTKIDTFHVKIIGVIPKFEGSSRTYILGRVLDGPMIKHKTNIVQGVSGSPVYIGGKLIGAMSMGWSLLTEPIVGITPIEDMLKTWSSDVSPADRLRSGPQPVPLRTDLPSPIVVDGKRIDRVRIGSPGAKHQDLPGEMTLVPMSGLLQVSGVNSHALQMLSDAFAKHGLQVAAGPSGGAVEKLRPAMVPGASIGAQLMRGDIDATALGTVTLVAGNRLLAFGHPFMEDAGNRQVDLPMTGGYVYGLMPNLSVSYKIMAPTQVVGRITRDSMSAIAGVLGGKVNMLPVTIDVKDASAPPRRFHVEVTRIKEYMPLLVSVAAMTAVDEARMKTGRGTARVTLTFDLPGRPSITRHEITYSDSDAGSAVVPFLLAPLAAFDDNPFGRVSPTGIHIRIETERSRETATIERVTVPQSRFKAGDTVPLVVTVRPYGKTPVDVPVQLPLPVDLPKGMVRIVVSSGSDADLARASIGAPKPAPTSLDQMLTRYAERNCSSDLVVQAALPRLGASLLGAELPDLPQEATDALMASRPTDLHPLPSVAKVVVPTSWNLSDRQMVTILVDSEVSPGAPTLPPSITGPMVPHPPTPAPSVEPDDDEPDSVSSTSLVGPVLHFTAVTTAASPAAVKPTAAAKTAAAAAKPGAAAASSSAEDQKPLTAAPAVWVENSRDDYTKAKTDGVSIAEDGALSLAPAASKPAPIPADVIWSIAARDGTAYVGTGTEGVIYKVSGDGRVTKFASTGEMNVHALAFDSQGNLLAGTSPHGRVLRISPDGTVKTLFDSKGTYIWTILVGADGTIYAGGGSPATVYAIGPDGKARTLATLSATNVLSLVQSKTGDLYAGTANLGLVYRIQPDGTVTTLAEVPGTSADTLVMDKEGTLYASSTPGGEIVRIPAGGLPANWADLDQTVAYDMAMLPDGDPVAVTGPNGMVMRVTGENKTTVLYRPETGIATALALSGDTLYFGTTAPTALHSFHLAVRQSGWLESAVLDSERPAKWGHITLSAEMPAGAAVKIETRSGNSPEPKERWSPWEPVVGDAIQSPPARYLQYRLTFTSKDGKAAPLVREVRITRQPQNLPPQVGLLAPSAGAAVSKKFLLKWLGRDPDKDTLTYDLALSSDMGQTWKTLKTGLTLPKYEWDTSKTPDGTYLLRVTASDAQSEPWSPETDTDSGVVIVDNTPPTLTLDKTSAKVGDDLRAKFGGLAADKLTTIQSVEYRVDAGDWRSLAFASPDSKMTSFDATTDPLQPGERKIEVRAFDAAGNVATDQLSVTVKGGAAAAASKAEEKKPDARPAAPAAPQKPAASK